MFSQQRYENELAEIFQRFPSVQNVLFGKAYKPGLGGMLAFVQVLGNPQNRLKFVHVAGTNGKGSVSNMIAAALTASSYRVGLYTSPHITDFRERMKIGGQMIPKEYVLGFIDNYRKDFERLNLSFFEITTGLALKWFADSKVDVAVIEVGLGGRLDSTNIITPCLSVITSIGLDHCDLLGNTKGKIAAEKAGIIKPGVPVVIGETDSETESVFRSAASYSGSAIYFADVNPTSFDAKYEQILQLMDLRGCYQAKNLRTVLSAIDLLKWEFTQISEESAKRGIVDTSKLMDFRGRWERLSFNPLTICDIGHNAHALRNNFTQLQSMLADGSATSLVIVYGIMADKDLDTIIPLMPQEASFVFTTPSSRRSLPAEEIYKRVEQYRGHNSKIFIREKVADAVEMAKFIADTDKERPVIYIGGSTFVVSEAVVLY